MTHSGYLHWGTVDDSAGEAAPPYWNRDPTSRSRPVSFIPIASPGKATTPFMDPTLPPPNHPAIPRVLRTGSSTERRSSGIRGRRAARSR